ncbi:ABC transporter ATP-binding protein [Pseudomonas sediminis]|uniref:ABC transporter ATP-binding protein n=1 Tax=Pseudomonas sediminis TaxID=1691904 RepID=UPI00244B2F6B|nr:ABC transporter ATP-binding protein [Pseudomonas sediminis]MDG9759558.1 ABC transporter ATP-binding protein [Pseudomonas sediminis]
MLKVEDIHAGYGDFRVLHGVSLEVEQQQAVGIVGPNGHGKSTLLKAVCGLLPVRSGAIWFQGEDITRLNAQQRVERGLVYVAEDRRLFGDMSVLENLQLGAYLPRARALRKQNLDRVFELYPRLAERRHQVARTLSGGEAQMLALGRGLMSAATCLAIDEPSLGLAPKLIETLLSTIAAINGSGMTIVLVEQNLSLIEPLMSRAYALEEGHIETLARPPFDTAGAA